MLKTGNRGRFLAALSLLAVDGRREAHSRCRAFFDDGGKTYQRTVAPFA
jgi:hypothetical protein